MATMPTMEITVKLEQVPELLELLEAATAVAESYTNHNDLYVLFPKIAALELALKNLGWKRGSRS